jgi:hypothetical protein
VSSSEVVQDVSSAEVQDVALEVAQDVASEEVQDVSSAEVQDVSSSEVKDVSSSEVQEPCPIDLSGTDQIIEKIDEILHEIPVKHSEDHRIETAIASLWLPPRDRQTAVLGSPMSRATPRG